MKPIHKFNNGEGATLCHNCSVIICKGLINEIYCDNCNVKVRAKNYMKLKKGFMTAKERAILLHRKYSKDYNRSVVMGKEYQSEHWKEVCIELAKLYKQ